MAREGTKRIETRTIERVPIKGDAFAGAMRDAIGNPGKLAVEGYCAAVWSLDEMDAVIQVYKMVGPGGYTKKGELTHREYDPKEVEPYLMATWGPGRYQLRVNHNGRIHSPVSAIYSVGEDERPESSTSGSDVDGAIADAAKRIGNVQALDKLNEITSPHRGGGLDLTGIAALLVAMKPDNAANAAMIDAANRRAEQAEQRNHELTLKMLDGRQGLAAGAAPVIGELFKYLKPEHLSMLMNPATADKPWWETVAELAREFAPALQAVVVNLMSQAGVQTPAVRALAPPQPTATDKMSVPGPSPTGGEGGSSMPLPLNEEQQYAKGIMLEYIKAGDWGNALAALENFPGFVPTDAGPMPMGVSMISRIDPKVNPRIYIGQLLMLMPELKGFMTQAQAFIEHIQKRILADDEEMRRQDTTPPAGPDPYRPTRAEGGE